MSQIARTTATIIVQLRKLKWIIKMAACQIAVMKQLVTLSDQRVLNAVEI